MPFKTDPLKTYNSVDYKTISLKLPKCHRFIVIITLRSQLSDNFCLLFFHNSFLLCFIFRFIGQTLHYEHEKLSLPQNHILCILFNKINKCLTFITLRTTFPFLIFYWIFLFTKNITSNFNLWSNPNISNANKK